MVFVAGAQYIEKIALLLLFCRNEQKIIEDHEWHAAHAVYGLVILALYLSCFQITKEIYKL